MQQRNLLGAELDQPYLMLGQVILEDKTSNQETIKKFLPIIFQICNCLLLCGAANIGNLILLTDGPFLPELEETTTTCPIWPKMPMEASPLDGQKCYPKSSFVFTIVADLTRALWPRRRHAHVLQPTTRLTRAPWPHRLLAWIGSYICPPTVPTL